MENYAEKEKSFVAILRAKYKFRRLSKYSMYGVAQRFDKCTGVQK